MLPTNCTACSKHTAHETCTMSPSNCMALTTELTTQHRNTTNCMAPTTHQRKTTMLPTNSMALTIQEVFFSRNDITQPHKKCVYSAQKANHRNRLHIQTNHKKAARRVRCYNAQSAHIHYWKILLTLVTMFLGLLSPWGQNHITVLMHSLKVLCQNTGRVVYPYMHATHYKYFVHVHVCNNSIKWAHQNQSKTFTVAVTLTWK